jgi:hypothetical protein
MGRRANRTLPLTGHTLPPTCFGKKKGLRAGRGLEAATGPRQSSPQAAGPADGPRSTPVAGVPRLRRAGARGCGDRCAGRTLPERGACHGPRLRSCPRRRIGCMLLISASPSAEVSLECKPRAASYDRPVSDSPYRVPVPRPPDPYLVGWANLRRRKAFAWAAALLWALAFTVTLPAMVARTRVVGIAAAVTVVCWVSRIVGNIVLVRFRCPRCGSSFYGARRTRAPWWSSACVTCGIAIGTPNYPRAGDAR